MDKKEFLQKFRAALSGQVPAYIIEENVRYYDEYIETQINHIEFFMGKLHNAIKQLRRSNSEPKLNAKYDELFSRLSEMLGNHNT